MELRIYDSHNFVSVDFGMWLIPKIKARLIADINKYSLKQFDEYINTTTSLDKLYSRIQYHSKDIIVFAANNLTCSGDDGEIVIRFDLTKLVPGFNQLRLNDAVKLINYGNLEIKGCPIFTNVFKHFEEEIDSYIGLYYNY